MEEIQNYIGIVNSTRQLLFNDGQKMTDNDKDFETAKLIALNIFYRYCIEYCKILYRVY